jgi:hypothetical protein
MMRRALEKSIPMPRDMPPPIPKEVLAKWYQKRRERMEWDRLIEALPLCMRRNPRLRQRPSTKRSLLCDVCSQDRRSAA